MKIDISSKPIKVEKEQYSPKSPLAKELFRRVNAYFTENDIRKTGDWRIYFKAFFFITLHWALYVVAVFLPVDAYIRIAAWSLRGLVTMPGIGFNVMHDASHGTFSSRPSVNNLFSYAGNTVGPMSEGWRIQHNVLHHGHTNIDELDPDINMGVLMRTSPKQKPKKIYKLQHIYCWPLYFLQTLNWIWVADFKDAWNEKIGTEDFPYDLKKKGSFELTKFIHFFIEIIIPLVYTGWVGVGGYFCMMGFSGITLALVFQSAHQVEPATIFQKGVMGVDWVIHQLRTTVNFITNKLFSWFIGGLNYQIEHHLFFNQISHVHYPAVAKIVQQVCKEYGQPYLVIDSFPEAIVSHGKCLYNEARAPWLQPVLINIE